MKIEYKNGSHVLNHNSLNFELTDAQLADIPYTIGKYLDTLPADVFERLAVELDRADLENADFQGVQH